MPGAFFRVSPKGEAHGRVEQSFSGRHLHDGRSSSGRTPDFDSGCGGSKNRQERFFMSVANLKGEAQGSAE